MQLIKSVSTSIRKANPQDKRKIARLEKLALQNWDRDNYSDREIAILTNKIDLPNFHDEVIFVAESNSTIVGFASFLSRRQIVRSLYVEPSYGDLETKSKLLEAIEQTAIKKRVKTLKATPSLKDKAFYNSQGYREIAVCHLDKMSILLPCIAMQKKLVPNSDRLSNDRMLLKFLVNILLATAPNLLFLL